ncbi:hypothetical protein [Planotetraspora mira]|jgi:hypothetical protein|uniref:Uncharacterized protein n=1 Tax=Planotetraspora mira TaxID=58121 RepID=A0A8J3XAE7_9ACTN|nr:hypothetical protein [Planotetraspora mira]GII33396.1 hypothetical protein Pmi06nite_68380 [Planotetraspora mira]
MRLRTALAGAGIAASLVGGIATPALAATWWDVGSYGTQKLCIDAGQQYQREGWPYKCLHVSATWALLIWQ